METVAVTIELLKGLGVPAITIIGFVWVIFKLNKLEAKLSSDIAKLDAKFTLDISGLKIDVRSIKDNHLPHIEAAINALAKGTSNEEHVRDIIDLSHKVDAV
jgi:hypothetical protein